MCLTVPLEKVGCSRIASLIEVGRIHRLQFVPIKTLLDSSPTNANVDVLILLRPILIINIVNQAVKVVLVFECENPRSEGVAITKNRRCKSQAAFTGAQSPFVAVASEEYQ